MCLRERNVPENVGRRAYKLLYKYPNELMKLLRNTCVGIY